MALYLLAAGPNERGADRFACSSSEGKGLEVLDRFDEDRLVRGLASVVALLLFVAGATVFVRTGKAPAPSSVLGFHEMRSPSADPTPSGQPTGVIDIPVVPPPARRAATPKPPTPPAANEPATQCHNSTDSSCGAFRWSPSPGGNAGMTISVQYPAEGTVGQAVTYVVTISDADAKPFGVFPQWGDGTGSTPPSCSLDRYGPWDPPAKSGGRRTFALKHTYSKAGTYHVRFVGQSGECGNPYANSKTIDAGSLRILAANSSEPSPTPSPSQSPFPI